MWLPRFLRKRAPRAERIVASRRNEIHGVPLVLWGRVKLTDEEAAKVADNLRVLTSAEGLDERWRKDNIIKAHLVMSMPELESVMKEL